MPSNLILNFSMTFYQLQFIIDDKSHVLGKLLKYLRLTLFGYTEGTDLKLFGYTGGTDLELFGYTSDVCLFHKTG